jgi:hypothetical protein
LATACSTATAAPQDYTITFLSLPVRIPSNLATHAASMHPSTAQGAHGESRLVFFHSDFTIIPSKGDR